MTTKRKSMSEEAENEGTTKVVPDDTAELNRQNDARMEEIERRVRQQPLTSDLCLISELDKQYETEEVTSNFRAGVTALKTQYGHIRMVRGDGNCYYRAFLYSLVEKILQHQQSSAESEAIKKEGERIASWLKNESLKIAVANGYDEMTIDMFHEAIVELLERVTTGQLTKLEELHTEMNEENATSDYCTWYMRVITASHLKSDPGRFLPFIETPGLDVQQFCQREVEPMVSCIQSFERRTL